MWGEVCPPVPRHRLSRESVDRRAWERVGSTSWGPGVTAHLPWGHFPRRDHVGSGPASHPGLRSPSPFLHCYPQVFTLLRAPQTEGQPRPAEPVCLRPGVAWPGGPRGTETPTLAAPSPWRALGQELGSTVPGWAGPSPGCGSLASRRT